MAMEIKPLHYGHSDGHTYICYSEDGEKLISCGGDGDVRIWNGFDDDDPLQTCLGEFALCVQHKNDHIMVAPDNNSVQLLSYPAGDRDGILTKFAGQVNHMATGRNHNWIAVAAEDMTVKIVELQSKETKWIDNLGGTPLSIAICSNVKYLAISCGDGNLYIYNIEDKSIVKQMNVVSKINSFLNAKLLCRTDFDQKNNKYFAYPDKNTVIVLNASNWSLAYNLTTATVDNSYSIVAFSPCSKYIAACTLEGDLVVWALRSQSVVGYKKHHKGIAITAIAWNPKENGDLAFADAEGYVGLAVNCINKDSPSFEETVSENHKQVDNDDDDGVDFGDVEIENAEKSGDDDDEDDENVVSLEKIKKQVMGSQDDDNDDKSTVRSVSPRPRSRTPEPPLQEPFMPSSTPDHLDPRYMCWNEVGIVRCYGCNLTSEEEGTKSIEVEFMDSSFHSSMMISNFQDYTMGSISQGALALANSSSINVVPLALSSKEWHLNMPYDSIEILCIATSQNLVCFAVNNYLVYVCSIYGTQRAVVSIPGPVLTMSAFGCVLMVAYHVGNVRKGDQSIDIMLVKLDGTSVENRNIKAALSPGSKLQWLGFTDVGTPALMDSEGMVFLHPLEANMWLPFCDTTRNRAGAIDGFFVTSIHETFGTIRGIKCKGSMYPTFTPRPIECELALQSPFMEINAEKSQLEANLFTWSTLQIENTSKKYKETALKAFALAVKNNLDHRALEFMEILENPQIVNLGVKYVSKLEKRRLAEKLIALANKLKDSDDADKEEDVTVSTPTNTIRPNREILSSVRKILSKSKTPSTPTTQMKTPTTFNESQDLFTPSSSKTSVTTPDASLLLEGPRNPFLKSLKKQAEPETYNPLSLTDKDAGVTFEKETKENKNTMNSTEKRKKPEDPSPTTEKKDKQRKLDRFLFAKRT